MARRRTIPGTAEAMPGQPGPAEQLNDDLEPVSSAPPPPRGTRRVSDYEPNTRTYRVWEHGTLHRDGRIYQPGETLTLPREIGDGIECLSPA